MKQIILILSLSLFSMILFARDDTDGFFVETGFKVAPSNNLVNLIGSTGITYNSNKMN